MKFTNIFSFYIYIGLIIWYILEVSKDKVSSIESMLCVISFGTEKNLKFSIFNIGVIESGQYQN